MNKEFWIDRWKENSIGFHLQDVNPLLVDAYNKLDKKGCLFIFVPLCGKSRDLIWLASLGHKVIGIEICEKAIIDFYTENNISYTISHSDSLTKYTSDAIDIYHGDIFDLSGGELGPIDLVYDRAATVALPSDMRAKYYLHMNSLITETTSGIYILFEYDQEKVEGPPFSVREEEFRMASLFSQIELYKTIDDAGLSSKFNDVQVTEKVFICN